MSNLHFKFQTLTADSSCTFLLPYCCDEAVIRSQCEHVWEGALFDIVARDHMVEICVCVCVCVKESLPIVCMCVRHLL